MPTVTTGQTPWIGSKSSWDELLIGAQSNRDQPVAGIAAWRPLYPVQVTESPTTAPGQNSGAAQPDSDAPPWSRYPAARAACVERTWQDNWAKLGTFNVPNPVGSLAPQDGTPVPDD